MALTKIDLVDMIYNELDIPKKECIDLVESFFDIIKDELAVNGDLKVYQFWRSKSVPPTYAYCDL
jgi:nucleoid DNA-binding protein